MNQTSKYLFNIFSAVIITLNFSSKSSACTIFSGKDLNGQVWTANNEDGFYSFNNYINIFPKTEDTRYGYYTLSYYSAESGENGGIEGGMNEAGLTYDFNSIDTTIVKDFDNKKPFPSGDDKILSHILANFEQVEEVVKFFEIYWFELGFTSAQMHVADKYGNYAIISPSGSRVLKGEKYQISTNFDICGSQDHSNTERYWRFPLVKKGLDSKPIGLKSFRETAELTAIKNWYSSYTIYTNIQNLNTGDIWFYYTFDYENPFETSINELLSKGRKSLLIKDLFPKHPISIVYEEFIEKGAQAAYTKLQSLKLSAERKKEIISIFVTSVLVENKHAKMLPFLEEYLTYEPQGYWPKVTQAIFYFQLGDTTKAKSIINSYKQQVPDTSLKVDEIYKLFDGQFKDDSNTTLVLNGYQDATSVFVVGLPVNFDFLIKKNGKWVGKYNLDQGIYSYYFLVDGKRVLDDKSPVTITSLDEPHYSHQINIGLSSEVYQTKIKVKVPNKADVVYIAGNQPNLGNWDSVYKLKKISDLERELTVELRYPARFKFNLGNGKSEGVVRGNSKDNENNWNVLEMNKETKNKPYIVTEWQENPE